MTLAAALFSLALLARAAPFEAKPGTVRFVRIANSAFDRCTKSPTPSEQAWMRGVGVDRAERRCLGAAAVWAMLVLTIDTGWQTAHALWQHLWRTFTSSGSASGVSAT